MMRLRILTLLVVVFGVVYSHTTPPTTPQTDEDNFIKLFGMMTKLQEHVTNLQNQQHQLKVKMMDSMDKQNEKLSNFEETLTKQYDQIKFHLQNEGGAINNNYYGCDNSTTMPPTQPHVTNAQDCTEVYSKGFTSEGVYFILPANSDPLDVYCQDGWTVLQKRTDDSIDYQKTMLEYERGFGSVRGEHWIGLNAMNKLTEQGSYTVRFELEDFEGDTAWAEYDDFHVDVAPSYTLRFNKYSYNGTAGNSLSYGNYGRAFTTFDVDQDDWSGVSCSTHNWPDGISYGGSGWWFGGYCGLVTTTGMPYGSTRSITWMHWKYSWDGLKSAIMKIKRV